MSHLVCVSSLNRDIYICRIEQHNAPADSSMPLFSRIPVLATPVISGLMCTHNDCFALFSTLDDSEAHAVAVHAGQAAATTCGIHERQLKNGKIKLYRVLEDSGEHFGNSHGPETYPQSCRGYAR